MQELEKKSDVLLPADLFTNYQVNKDKSSPSYDTNKSLMKNSLNELKISKRRISNIQGLEGLPGLNETLLSNKNNDNFMDDISQTIRDEQKKTDTLLLLPPCKKLFYMGLIALLTICRSSLYPLMAAIPQPIVHKLVWRSLIVSFR